MDDLCRAVLLALESAVLCPAQCEVSGEVFQIATGVEMSILGLADLVQGVVAEQDVEVQRGPPRQGDIRKNYSVVTKAQRILAWEPKTDLEEGLQGTWDWFQMSAGG